MNKFNSKSKHEIQKFRNDLFLDNSIIDSEALGANKISKITVSKLSRSSSSRVKYLHLLFSVINYMNYENVLELGTCCGLSAATMSISCSKSKITTVEGDKFRYDIAKKYFKKWQLDNINLLHSDFDSALNKLINSNSKFDLIFIDGDHSYQATIRYFKMAQRLLTDTGMIIIDDIYWSKGMKRAWKEIIAYENINLTIDIFQMGIIFNLKNFAKQNFVIRY